MQLQQIPDSALQTQGRQRAWPRRPKFKFNGISNSLCDLGQVPSLFWASVSGGRGRVSHFTTHSVPEHGSSFGLSFGHPRILSEPVFLTRWEPLRVELGSDPPAGFQHCWLWVCPTEDHERYIMYKKQAGAHEIHSVGIMLEKLSLNSGNSP